MTITGTNHFVSMDAAIYYYSEYGYDAADVCDKQNAGEIAIGKPELKPGQTLSVIDNGTRYAITDRSDKASGLDAITEG
jgi:hypothetical protein